MEAQTQTSLVRRIQQKLVGIGSDEWNQFYNNADSIYKYDYDIAIWTRT